MKIEGLNLRKLLSFLNDNAEILHKSRYHYEGFRTHCLLVIAGMLEKFESGVVSEPAFVAACLHDIGKPRTAKLNKRGEACFYGHENVTEEEIAAFLSPDYPEFQKVLDLVRGHMLPLGTGEETPEPYRSKNLERLNQFLDAYDEQFEKDLMALSDCDKKSCVKSDDDLPAAEAKADETARRLLQ